MVFESAKPWHEADGDVIEAIDYLRYYAQQGEGLSRPTQTQDVPGEENYYFHEGRGVTVKEGRWGYRVLVIDDLDGNQIFVPYPNEPGQPPA